MLLKIMADYLSFRKWKQDEYGTIFTYLLHMLSMFFCLWCIMRILPFWLIVLIILGDTAIYRKNR